MHHFQFQNPTKIIFGAGQIANLTRNIPQGSKVLMLYGGGSIKSNGVYEQVKKALAAYEFLEFGGIEANPRYETLMKAVEYIRKENIDFLLAVGGGSVIDGTKFIAAAVYYQGDAWEICTGAKIIKAMPFGSILTLPATGSEMNSGAVISRESTHEKLAFSSPLTYPIFSILDPTVTLSLPPRQRANGVVDAFIHVTEQYLTYPVDAPVQDRFSEGLLLTLIENGKTYVEHPENMEAASNIVWASTLALNGLIAVGVPEDWGTHMIGHEITAFTGLDHAQTLAIVWPRLQTALKESKREKLLQFASRVWNITQGSEDERITAAIAKTEAFFQSLGVKTHLSEYGIEKGLGEKIAERFTQRGTMNLGEKGEITPSLSSQIVNQSY